MNIEALFPLDTSYKNDACRSRAIDVVLYHHSRPEDWMSYKLWVNDAEQPESEDMPLYTLTVEDSAGRADELAAGDRPDVIARALALSALDAAVDAGAGNGGNSRTITELLNISRAATVWLSHNT